MLTPEYLDGVAEPLQALYSELESDIMADIARRVAKADYSITATAEWQIYKLQAIGASQKYISQQIAKTLKISEKEVLQMFKSAGVKSISTDIELQKELIAQGRLPADMVSLSAMPYYSQIMLANAKRTQETFKKLTNTTAIDASGKLNQYMDECQMLIQSGATTQEQAIDQTVRKFSADGVQTFDYISGTRTSIEIAVRRAAVTGVNQATSEISLANASELETDLVEVTSHQDARPAHAKWQGQIYSRSGMSVNYKDFISSTGYGTGAGLCGWNCRHSFFAYVEGISEKIPRQKYDVKVYQAEQEQRYNERKIRYWKKRKNALEAAKIDASKETARISAWQKKQRELMKSKDLTRDYQREKVW